jgi:hypothetical protein
MKLIEKGKDGAEPVHMGWDAAQAALATGTYDLAPSDGERDVDLPGAQSPAPGTDPVDGEERAAEGHVLTNMTAVAAPETVSAGLAKAPEPPKPAPAKNPAPPPASAPVVVPVPVPAATKA